MESKFEFAKQLIREAGQLILKHLSDELVVEEKGRFDDLVTSLDKEVQDFLVTEIHKHYPADAILAEENNLRHSVTDGKVWVLDPIDGTVNFIVQRDYFAILIAYYEDGLGQFGLIYDVINDRLFHGGGIFDVYMNDELLSPYQDKPLSRSLIGGNSGMYAQNEHGIRDFIQQSLGLRVYGGAGISMGYVLTGKLMAYFSYLQPWDYAAAKILGDKLGYVLLTLDGNEPDFTHRQKVMFVPKVKLALIKKAISSHENS
ncbi:inositol monophosphatase family protein [Streptococcus hyointestinalis]|uniref:Inositol monophosphatase family protein n=1 Tax=Streptococcus hyointestinalis TaxID=1337 RepID=A0A380KC60_9STRE|nr:inositol monophosphatase family protein [Streptococcus hyointestinalis]SUN62224.1 inositol monophosphatase family protein [Streptococcus hyointestinalis]